MFMSIPLKKFNRNIKKITPEAENVLLSHDWPGNIRELSNIVERIVALNKKEVITENDIPYDFLFPSEQDKPKPTFNIAKQDFERDFVLKVMEQNRWNRTKAAKALGIHRNSLAKMISRLKILPPDSQPK